MLVESIQGVAIVALDVGVKASMRQFVAEKVANGECLQGPEPADPKRRGLCKCHYDQFRASLAELPVSERVAHEAKCIKDGKILSGSPGRKRGVVNPFRRVG